MPAQPFVMLLGGGRDCKQDSGFGSHCSLTSAEAAVNLARSVDGDFAEALAHRVWAEALVGLNPPNWDAAETSNGSLSRLNGCKRP